MDSQLLRRVFWWFNTLFMIPMFRLGLGAFMGNPFSGYIMVLKTVGRKTGKQRYTPVNYAIRDGCVYCVAGYGARADWYRNLQANRLIELMMPGGALAGQVEDVTDADEAARALRQIFKNGGFAGFFLGFNPYTVPEATLRAKTQGLPVVRIRPMGLGSSAADPGGWLWVALGLGTVLALALIWLLAR